MTRVKAEVRTARSDAPSARPRSSAARPCFGSHLSVAGGMHHAIEAARRLKLDTVQVFVKNQRQWRAPPLVAEAVARWHRERAASGFEQIVAHATYLINLASPDAGLRDRSCEALREELERCDALAIRYLVLHPGSAVGLDVPAALRNVAKSLNRVLAACPRLSVLPLLETTAGQGRTLGRTFDELAQILGALDQPERAGVCIDTCHVFAAGYDIRDAQAYAAMIAEAERLIGLPRIRCWHLNDSRGALGSRVDRHEHIGRGQIGLSGFRHVLNDARFCGLPMILETPKGVDERGRAHDVLNLRRLRRLGPRG